MINENKIYYTWEGEKIDIGDILEDNDGSKGKVEIVYFSENESEVCWVPENRENRTISLETLELLSSKRGCTLLHKVS